MAAAAADPGPPPNGPTGPGQRPYDEDSATAAGRWFAAYTDYLRRSSDQSVEAVALYQEVTDRVARGELDPSATHEMLTSFLRSRGTTYSAQVGDLLMRFFTETVKISTEFANGLGKEILPEAVGLEVPTLPFNPNDPSAWYGQLSEFAQALGGSITTVYKALMDRAAAGTLEQSEMESIASGFVQRRLPEMIAELGRLYFELLNGLTDVRIRAEREYLEGLIDGAAERFELSLRAPVGESATATLSIENTRPEPARVRCVVRDLRRADGVGPAFVPELGLGADGIELAPGQEGTVSVGVRLDEALFEPGVQYVGRLEVTGHGDQRLEVPLRIQVQEARPTA